VRAFARGGENAILAVLFYYITNSLQNRRFCTEAELPRAHIAQANFRCSKTNFAIRQSVRAFARGGEDCILAVLFYYITLSEINQGVSLVYHPQLVAVYHQCGVLYIIKPQGNTR